ncbi:MAG TPA: dihydrolipoyl dehydrogenase [Dehalococcoidia bacterium]|nr:dihydrolipoyl dehydrogenase [Dehalococcoidia bacterium]
MPDFDIAIIGSGPGGYVAAIRAAQLGLKTAIIEKSEIGGLCLNWGCIPSKALLHSADLVNEIRRATAYGIGYDNLRLDLGVAVDRSREVVTKMVGGVKTLLEQNKVEVIRGTAKLASPTRVTITPENRSIEAANVIVATGAVTRSLPGVPIDGDRILTSREALELKRPPASIVIVGAGPIGAEFGYLYRTFGSEVTIVEMLDRVLPNEDADVSRAVERAFKAQGIAIKTSTKVEGIKAGEGGVTVTVSSGDKREDIVAERCLIGVGFGPNTEGLGLQEAGVELDRGWVKIDEYARTNIPGVYAIGDVTGRLLLAHVASHQGITAVETIAGHDPPPLDYDKMPRAVYCEPQVGSLGLSEAQAKEQGRKVGIGRFPIRANGKAIALGESEGFVKLVVDEESHDILGYHIVGPNATEMIAEASLAAVLETTPAEIAYAVHAHPTLAEAFHEAGMAFSGQSIHFYAPLRQGR